MLVRFSVKNYKTFKDTATLNMVASNYFKESEDSVVEIKAGSGKLRLLKSAVIYGANASGKSKFLDAMQFMREFVRNSSKDSQADERISITPFLLSTTTEDKPSTFEIVFVNDDIQFRYGFEADATRVISEWLYRKEFRVEVEVFARTESELHIHPQLFRNGSLIEQRNLLRPNALLLSAAAQFNDDLALTVLRWFGRFRGISGMREAGHLGFTVGQIKKEEQKAKIISLLEAADIGIDDLNVAEKEVAIEEMPPSLARLLASRNSEPEKIVSLEVSTSHKRYNENMLEAGNVTFDMDEEESAGTRKFFALLGPLLDTCETGSVLLADELDSQLHPNLVAKIISYFHNANSNPKNAQLIFNTHNTNLLNKDVFRRDQIWFTQKDRYGAAKLYSLADFKKPNGKARKQENFEKNYLEGRYSGIPYLNKFGI